MLWRVVPFKSSSQTPGVLWSECFIQCSWRVGAEIVADQHELLCVGIALIAEHAKQTGKIDAGLAVGDFHVPLACQRFECHEKIGHTSAEIFAVVPSRLVGANG